MPMQSLFNVVLLYYQELNDFLSGDDAVIYISFGTALSAKCIPQQWKDALVAALKKLPYKVIWKFDEIIPNLSKNILQMNWTPQQDVLGTCMIVLNIFFEQVKKGEM